MLIAQVSDIHAAPENDHLRRFDRVLTWLAHLRPDVLVLTGDLTDGHWLEGYQHLSARLHQQHYPSLILPGNSDDPRLIKAIWGDNRGAREPLHFIHDVHGLKLIGLDSTVHAQEYGCVADHLAWLEKQLMDASGSPVILFTHHHVFASGIPTLDESLCRGLPGLDALIRRTPARLLAIASGHVHRPVAGTFAGVPAFICGSVCPANPVWFGSVNVPPAGDPPALMIHRYVDNVLTSHHVSV